MSSIRGNAITRSKKFPDVEVAVRGGQVETDDQGWEHHEYSVRVRSMRTLAQMTSRYGTGLAHTDLPTADAVLSALVLDARTVLDSDGFEDWARDFGYDPDSRKAEAAYQECVKTDKDLRRVLGAQYDDVIAAEWDD